MVAISPPVAPPLPPPPPMLWAKMPLEQPVPQVGSGPVSTVPLVAAPVAIMPELTTLTAPPLEALAPPPPSAAMTLPWAPPSPPVPPMLCA